eukprot:m.146067 g.146067  ORF g.146067 m.146067 type:complete len:380 (-) comp17237_c3_seq1:362-1501(-)
MSTAESTAAGGGGVDGRDELEEREGHALRVDNSSEDEETSEEDNDGEDGGGGGLLLLRPDHLTEPTIQFLWADLSHNYYLSLDWSKEMYSDLAYNGFISVTHLPYLVPEIQKRYCVMDWQNLKVTRNTRKRARRYRLAVDTCLDDVFAGITQHHGDSNWVIPQYQDVLRQMLEPTEIRVSGGTASIQVHSIELLDEDGTLAAGEVGYVIGSTYTSLTGFFAREYVDDCDGPALAEAPAEATGTGTPASPATAAEAEAGAQDTNQHPSDEPRQGSGDEQAQNTGRKRKLKYDGAGIVQVTALSRLLERQGFAFWSLGHPPRPPTATEKGQMMYKQDMGAHVISRRKFVEKFCAARSGLLPLDLAPTSAAELLAPSRSSPS